MEKHLTISVSLTRKFEDYLTRVRSSEEEHCIDIAKVGISKFPEPTISMYIVALNTIALDEQTKKFMDLLFKVINTQPEASKKYIFAKELDWTTYGYLQVVPESSKIRAFHIPIQAVIGSIEFEDEADVRSKLGFI